MQGVGRGCEGWACLGNGFEKDVVEFFLII